jgi:hypothetical protein
MNKTRNYRERKQESVSMNILHVIFDTKEMYEKAKTHFDSDGPSPFWAGDWNDETRTIEFAEENSVDTLEVALTADMESAGIEGYHFELADTMELEPEEDEDNCNSIMVLYFVDEDNTKDMLLAARKSDLEAGNKRQEIEQCLRETFNIDERKEWEDCDPEGMERGLQKAADKLAKGEQAYFDTYDFAWEKVSII